MGANEPGQQSFLRLTIPRGNPFQSIKFFVLCHGLLQLSQLMVSGYLKSTISTVEKRFGLTSQTSGMVSSLNEIGNTVFIVFVSYFGSCVHRPRLIGCGGLLVCLATFLMATPHFIMDSYKYDQTVTGGNLTIANNTDICQESNMYWLLHSGKCGIDTRMSEQRMLYLLVLGQLLLGIGSVPIQPFGISYIDDFASEQNSPMYLAILFAVSVLGPGFGFVLGFAMLRFFVDLDKLSPGEINMEPSDPRWVGAWWLGFLVAGSCVAFSSIPYFFFPRKLTKEVTRDVASPGLAEKSLLSELKSSHVETQKLSLLQFIKSFPLILWRTLKNPVYLLVVLGQVSMSAMISGLSVFMGKFLEKQFTLTASFANLMLGGVTIPGIVIGTIVGGAIMRRLKITMRGAVLMCIVCILTCACLTSPLLHLGCSTQAVAGINWDLDPPRWTLNPRTPLMCSANCSCDSQSFNPICSSNGVEFVSPCLAGCKSISFTTAHGGVQNYTDCSCLPTGQWATPGTCGTSCSHLLMLFMLLLTLMGFVASLCQTPSFILVLRSVEPQDKSFAIGIQYMLFRALAWLPGPILYGRVIDKTCIYWETKCGEQTACRYYDLDQFRFSYMGVQVLFECGALIFFLAASYFVVKRHSQRRETEGEKERVVTLTDTDSEKNRLKDKLSTLD